MAVESLNAIVKLLKGKAHLASLASALNSDGFPNSSKVPKLIDPRDSLGKSEKERNLGEWLEGEGEKGNHHVELWHITWPGQSANYSTTKCRSSTSQRQILKRILSVWSFLPLRTFSNLENSAQKLANVNALEGLELVTRDNFDHFQPKSLYKFSVKEKWGKFPGTHSAFFGHGTFLKVRDPRAVGSNLVDSLKCEAEKKTTLKTGQTDQFRDLWYCSFGGSNLGLLLWPHINPSHDSRTGSQQARTRKSSLRGD